MTITTSAAPPPMRNRPVVLVRGFLTGGVAGVFLAAVVVGIILSYELLIAGGVCLLAVYVLIRYLAGLPRRTREAEVPPYLALAVIESLEAVGGETSDIPVKFDLTVAPDDAPAFRVEFTQDINLADLPDYRPRRILVVQYPPDRPLKVRIVKRPAPDWEERASSARLDSAPGPARASEAVEGCGAPLVGFLGLLLGAALVVLLFRADLSDHNDSGTARPSVSSSSTSSSSTTSVSSASGTVALGPGQSFLEEGVLGRTVAGLARGADRQRALTVVVQERLLTVVFAPAGARAAPRIDLDSLPYERVPALVKEATTTLGVASPRTWQVIADGLTGRVALRVSVSGSEGTAYLEADGQGQVVRRVSAGG
ncbi:hypothetical protein [Streptomyces sp. OR43]|uniref:hypothetical protein n=1 Tax=Streptomyces sp. or43 TaxID=2478957 RepID=UPI0011CDD1A5|nr:hypothetical protein [Streptomyces sp. or43]TXS39787.1 hypothetical protein EAO72_18215 [Streptomyces sp. or43]